MRKEISRRSFLKTGTAAAIGLSMAPEMLAKKKKKDEAPLPMDRKLKILAVGIGAVVQACFADWRPRRSSVFATLTGNMQPRCSTVILMQRDIMTIE